MKNSDEAIDKLFAALRETEAPPGIEQRIVEAMEAHPAAASRQRHPFAFLAGRWPQGLACALAGTAILGFYLAHRSVPRPQVFSVGGPSNPPANLTRIKRVAVPTRTFARPLPPHFSFTTANPASSRLRPESAPALLDAAFVPSQLAPPLPITEQERLLIRIVHLGDVVEVAMLRPADNAAQKLRNDAEFDEFFAAPPPPPPIPQTESTDKLKGETP